MSRTLAARRWNRHRRVPILGGMTEADRRVLEDYSAGRRGTRATIEALGMADYGDLLVALAQADLPFPKPPDTPALAAHREAARAILMPLLMHGA